MYVYAFHQVGFDHDQAERRNRIRLSVLSILWQRYMYVCAGKVLLSACTDLLILLSGICGPPLCWIQQPITRTTMQLSGFNHCFLFFCHRVKNIFCTFTYSSAFSRMTRKTRTALESFLLSSNDRQSFISKSYLRLVSLKHHHTDISSLKSYLDSSLFLDIQIKGRDLQISQ